MLGTGQGIRTPNHFVLSEAALPLAHARMTCSDQKKTLPIEDRKGRKELIFPLARALLVET